MTDEGWIRLDDHMPPDGVPVLVTRRLFSGPASNPAHPGYATGRWVECSQRWGNGFACDLISTGQSTHWRYLPEPAPAE